MSRAPIFLVHKSGDESVWSLSVIPDQDVDQEPAVYHMIFADESIVVVAVHLINAATL